MNEGQVQAAGTPAKGRKYKYLIGAVLLVAVLVAAGLVVWYRVQDNEGKPTFGKAASIVDIKESAPIINKEFLTYAQTEVEHQNYKLAVKYYLQASNVELDAGRYKEAKAAMQLCVSNVPDANVTAEVYYTLASAARSLEDAIVEKDSLQKALARADQSDSGVDTISIDRMNKRLGELQ